MAIRSEEWRRYQERDAARRAALIVADAVFRFDHDRELFYRLQKYAGLNGGKTIEQKALHDEFCKVCN